MDMLVYHVLVWSWVYFNFRLLVQYRVQVLLTESLFVLQEVTLVHLQLRQRSRWMPALCMLEM